MNPDYSITLLSFANNDVRGEGITTVPSTAVVPEPSLLALAPAGALALALGLRRRHARFRLSLHQAKRRQHPFREPSQ